MIKVLEVDQWSSTGNIRDFGFSDFDIKKVKDGDSEAARAIFGGHSKIMEVEENDRPDIGNAWFIEDSNTKKFVFYKANYDSSD